MHLIVSLVVSVLCGFLTFNFINKTSFSDVDSVEIEYEIESFYDHVIIEQYTGLKDKNGKEIYEGDILKTDGVPNVTVFWCEQEGRWNGKYHGLFGPGSECEINGSVPWISETVGNIHENPELLK